jgi:hypothetical protein
VLGTWCFSNLLLFLTKVDVQTPHEMIPNAVSYCLICPEAHNMTRVSELNIVISLFTYEPQLYLLLLFSYT